MSSITCKAKNPSTCRYHRLTNFTDEIVTLIRTSQLFPIEHNGKTREGYSVETLTSLTQEATNQFADYVEKNPDTTEHTRRHELEKILKTARESLIKNGNYGRNDEEHLHLYYAPLREIATGVELAFNRAKKPDRYHTENNYLGKDDAEPFTKAALLMVQEEGYVVSTRDSYYGGWQDQMSTKHLKECGIAYLSEPQEESRYSFAGTFADADQRSHGLSSNVRCNCNAVQGTLRAEDDFESMTRNLVNKYARKVYEQ